MKVTSTKVAAWVLGATALPAVGWAGCGDEGGGDPVEVACAEGPTDKPVGCVYGKLVDGSGKAVEGARVSACTDVECLIATTTGSGVYDIQGLTPGPHHIEVLGEPLGVFTMVWWQDVPAGVQSRLSESVVVQPLAGATKVAWAPDAGGKVLLADGRLELEAAPGALKYAPGTLDKSVQAIEVDVDELPPFDIAPWEGKEEASRAFIINPFPLKASAPIKLRIIGEPGVATSTPYRVYSADPVWGNLEDVGLVTADGSGDLVSASGGSLKDLTTLVIVPN